MDGNSPYHHEESRTRNAFPNDNSFCISTSSSNRRYTNGEVRNGDTGLGWKQSLPSPSYDRDPAPLSPLRSPLHTSSPLYNRQNDVDKKTKIQDIEKMDLDELLAICSEYQRENQIERITKPVQNRIKTNGSLPREKRLHSPVSPSLQYSFTFDWSDTRQSNEIKEPNKDSKKTVHTYENVVINSGSPRSRIKTFLHKDNHPKDNCGNENNPNKIPSSPEDEKQKSLNNNIKNENKNVNGGIETSQYATVIKRNRVDKKMTEDSSITPDRPLSTADLTAEKKYNFLGFDPRKGEVTSEPRLSTSSPSGLTPTSPPSWTNPKLDYKNFPDYEMINGEENVESVDFPCSVLKANRRVNNVKFDDYDDDIYNSKNIIEDLKYERNSLLKSLHFLKDKISELELQEEELIRETEIEEALVSGELAAQDEKLKQEERKIQLLKEKAKEYDEEMERCLEAQSKSQIRFKIVNEKHLAMIDILERKILLCNDKDLKYHLEESLRDQQELLDAERKSHEVLEFQLVEEEASWLSKKEDLQKDIDEAVSKLETRKQKVGSLHRPPQTVNNNLEVQRISHLKAIEEGRSRLNYINAELERISKYFPSVDSISNSSTQVVKRRVTSQDDLDRICKVTSGAPIDMGSSNSLGRRTIASLKEIERNRQLHLVNQGSLVIEEERQRVEELKRRVQDEVKAQWEQQRNSNCQSLTSITSDESSLEPTRDSGVSSEEVEKHIIIEEMKNFGDQHVSSETPESRPLSDASGYSDDQLSVKLRAKSSAIQRPLTRYLPIKSESLNLRSHIESAGHQVEVCSHVRLDATSCRGFLSKMGSRFRTWRKRWFVFDRAARTFSYYSDASEKKRRGGTHFEAIEEVYVDHLNSFKSPNPKVTFVVKSNTRSYHLIAPSPEAMRIWVDVIFTGAEGYQLYSQH